MDSSHLEEIILNKEKYMTARWNNLLLLIFGIPIFIYAVVALSTGFLTDFTGFIVMVVAGAVY